MLHLVMFADFLPHTPDSLLEVKTTGGQMKNTITLNNFLGGWTLLETFVYNVSTQIQQHIARGLAGYRHFYETSIRF